MKKYEVVKSNELFNTIIQKGHKESNKDFIIFYMEKKEYKPSFGIAVSKKVGKAVVRNKIKRQIRNIIDKNKFIFKNNYNYIIMIKKEACDLKYSKKEESLVDLVRKVKYEK